MACIRSTCSRPPATGAYVRSAPCVGRVVSVAVAPAFRSHRASHRLSSGRVGGRLRRDVCLAGDRACVHGLCSLTRTTDPAATHARAA